MGKFINKLRQKEDYSFISEEDLEKLKNRGIELKLLVEDSLKKKDYKSAQDYSVELAEIIKKVRKYKKYAKS